MSMPDYQTLKKFIFFSSSNVYKIRILIILTLLLCLNKYYTQAQKTSSSLNFKYRKGYYHLLNEKGRVNKSIDPFSFAEPFSEGLALVENDLKFGYINPEGKLVLDHQFYNAGSFSEGLAYFSYGDKYGYINKRGEVVIPPKFEMVRDFNGEYAKVLKTNPDTLKYGSGNWIYGYINRQGELIGDSYFSGIYYNKDEDVFKASIGDSDFHVSKEGKITSREKKPVLQKTSVDEMPQYPGGDMGLRKHIATSVRYPISAQENGKTGRIYIQFIVNAQGCVCEVYPVCNECPVLMKEAVRVVKQMNDWKPGVHEGKPIKVSYTVPINFVLQ